MYGGGGEKDEENMGSGVWGVASCVVLVIDRVFFY